MPFRSPLGAPVPAAPPCRRHRPCRVAGDWQSVCRRVLAKHRAAWRNCQGSWVGTAVGFETIEAVADRGYYSGEEIVACEQPGITVYVPKPMTSGLLAKGRFGKQDFVYVAADDVYLCPSGEQLTYHYTNEEDAKTLRRYWTNACQGCALKGQCTTGKERRISRWEHEAVLEAVQARLDRNPAKMRLRRQTVEHPFGTIKSWMGATHFQMKTLQHIGTEMALHVLAYNMKRVISILGVGGLMEAIRA